MNPNNDSKPASETILKPITEAVGPHPVGTGVGAAGGAVVGATVGTALGGPIGTVVGGAVGAAAGALAGETTAQVVNPTTKGSGPVDPNRSRP